METQERIICRFCLEICDTFRAIEGGIKEVLEVVLPKMVLTAIHKPVVCTNCAELLNKCFKFKATCLNTHIYIISFDNNEDFGKLNLVDVYLSKNGNSSRVPEGYGICRFCMTPVKHCSAISLEVEETKAMVENMMEKCIPELDLSIMKKCVICASCHSSLKMFFNFVTHCLNIEGDIKRYRETLDVNNKNHIELRNLLEFTMRDVKVNEVDHSVDLIKVEKQFCEEESGDLFKLEQMSCEDVNIKDETEEENKNLMSVDEEKLNTEEQFLPETMLAPDEETGKLDEIKREEKFCEESGFKEENFIEMEDQKFLHNTKVEMETDKLESIRFENVVLQPVCTTRLRRGRKPTDPLKPKPKKDPTTYMCERCSFTTNRKGNLKLHMMLHRDPSELTMYKCEFCSYQTIYKCYLKTHFLKHKEPSELTMYKCEYCPFETKFKSYIRKHQAKHKTPSKVIMYSCAFCSYQTKWLGQLKSHLLIHKNASDVTINNSASGNNLDSVKSDLLIREDASGATIFNCATCPHQTTSFANLKAHLLSHKDCSEVKKNAQT